MIQGIFSLKGGWELGFQPLARQAWLSVTRSPRLHGPLFLAFNPPPYPNPPGSSSPDLILGFLVLISIIPSAPVCLLPCPSPPPGPRVLNVHPT